MDICWIVLSWLIYLYIVSDSILGDTFEQPNMEIWHAQISSQPLLSRCLQRHCTFSWTIKFWRAGGVITLERFRTNFREAVKPCIRKKMTASQNTYPGIQWTAIRLGKEHRIQLLEVRSDRRSIVISRHLCGHSRHIQLADWHGQRELMWGQLIIPVWVFKKLFCHCRVSGGITYVAVLLKSIPIYILSAFSRCGLLSDIITFVWLINLYPFLDFLTGN